MAANGEGKGKGEGKGNSNTNTGRDSARQTTGWARSRSPCQRDADADMASKQTWVNSSVSGFWVGKQYVSSAKPAEEMTQPHQALYESQRTVIKRVDNLGPSRVMEDAVETHSCIPDYAIVTEKEAQLQQESARQTTARGMLRVPCQRDTDMAQKQKWVNSSVSSAGAGGNLVLVDDLLRYASHGMPRTPAEEKAQLRQALYNSQWTARKQIDDAGPSRVMEDAAKTHSCSPYYDVENTELQQALHKLATILNKKPGNYGPFKVMEDATEKRSCIPDYVIEKEAQLQQESARQTTAIKRSLSPCQRGADIAQKQKLVKLSVSGSGEVGDMCEDVAETSSFSNRRLIELEAELQQALHKLARIIKEELGSFGPSRAVKDAAEDVHATTECNHQVQGNQNIDDPNTLQLSTQVQGNQNIDDPYSLRLSTQVQGNQNIDVPYSLRLSTQVQGNQNIDDPYSLRLSTQVQGNQNIDDPYSLRLSTQVQGNQNIDDPYSLRLSTQVQGNQNIDDPYSLRLSTQRGALAPVRPMASQAEGLP